MITRDDIDITPYYFGDNSKQQKVIDSLSNALIKNKAGVYLVIGGSRTGKSSAVEQVKLNLTNNKSFVPLKSAEAYFSNDLFGELKAAVKTSYYNSLDEIGDEYLPVYESNTHPPHKILFINEGFVLPEDEAGVRKIIDAQRKLSLKEPFSVVIDSPNRCALLLPGANTIESGKKANKTQESLKRLAKDYPDLQVLTTSYNRQQIEEELWKLGNDYPVAEVREELRSRPFNVNVKHPAIIGVFNALKEKNREKYDIAFERIPSVEVQI